MIKATVLDFNVSDDRYLEGIAGLPRKERYEILLRIEISLELDIPMFLLFELLKTGQWKVWSMKPILEKGQEVFYSPDDYIAQNETELVDLKESVIDQQIAQGYYSHGHHKAIASYHWLKACDVHDSQCKYGFPQSQMVRVIVDPSLARLIASLGAWKKSTPELRQLRTAIIKAVSEIEGNPFAETVKYVKSINT